MSILVAVAPYQPAASVHSAFDTVPWRPASYTEDYDLDARRAVFFMAPRKELLAWLAHGDGGFHSSPPEVSTADGTNLGFAVADGLSDRSRGVKLFARGAAVMPVSAVRSVFQRNSRFGARLGGWTSQVSHNLRDQMIVEVFHGNTGFGNPTGPNVQVQISSTLTLPALATLIQGMQGQQAAGGNQAAGS